VEQKVGTLKGHKNQQPEVGESKKCFYLNFQNLNLFGKIWISCVRKWSDKKQARYGALVDLLVQ